MKLKRIKTLKVNSYTFKVIWNKSHNGGSFKWVPESIIDIGIKDISEDTIFMIICHELMEICTVEMNVRMQRPDCDTDYIFVYDHRQYDTMMMMFAGLLSQFIK